MAGVPPNETSSACAGVVKEQMHDLECLPSYFAKCHHVVRILDVGGMPEPLPLGTVAHRTSHRARRSERLRERLSYRAQRSCGRTRARTRLRHR